MKDKEKSGRGLFQFIFFGNFLDGVREATKYLMFHAKVSHRILPSYTSDRMQRCNTAACRTKKFSVIVNVTVVQSNSDWTVSCC